MFSSAYLAWAFDAPWAKVVCRRNRITMTTQELICSLTWKKALKSCWPGCKKYFVEDCSEYIYIDEAGPVNLRKAKHLFQTATAKQHPRVM